MGSPLVVFIKMKNSHALWPANLTYDNSTVRNKSADMYRQVYKGVYWNIFCNSNNMNVHW